MKQIALLLTLALLMIIAPAAAYAQNHGEIGAFLDYTRLKHANNANFWGLGARVALNAGEHVQLEAEGAYDFQRAYVNTFTTGGTATTGTTRLRLLDFLFGPKFQTGGQAIRAFVTLKGGLLNFSVSNGTAASGFTSATTATNIFKGDSNGVFYPGGGLEFFAGPIGLRAEIGDEIYFDRGANHNLKFTIGPQFRF
jgi:hypothetical protein